MSLNDNNVKIIKDHGRACHYCDLLQSFVVFDSLIYHQYLHSPGKRPQALRIHVPVTTSETRWVYRSRQVTNVKSHLLAYSLCFERIANNEDGRCRQTGTLKTRHLVNNNKSVSSCNISSPAPVLLFLLEKNDTTVHYWL